MRHCQSRMNQGVNSYEIGQEGMSEWHRVCGDCNSPKDFRWVSVKGRCLTVWKIYVEHNLDDSCLFKWMNAAESLHVALFFWGVFFEQLLGFSPLQISSLHFTTQRILLLWCLGTHPIGWTKCHLTVCQGWKLPATYAMTVFPLRWSLVFRLLGRNRFRHLTAVICDYNLL